MPENISNDIKKLLEDITNDDEIAFREIFDHYKIPFYATALKMTRSETIAEEIVQEAFVAIWIKRKLVAAANTPKAYIFTILHNCIYAHFRKLTQERLLKLKIERKVEFSEDVVESLLIEKEDREKLERVINQLPPQQKIIYKLAKQQGYKYEEIAVQLNISPNTVRNHLSAAVAHLRNSFGKLTSIIISAVTLYSSN